MAINKKFISFATQAQFDAKVAELDDRSIVFIEDTKRIWTHGVFFDTPWNYVTGKPNTLSDYGITDAALKVNSLYYVEGNTSGTAGSWTGTIPEITSLYTGLTIAYKIGVAGAATTNLDINGYGNKIVRRNNTNLTTHLPVSTVVILTYDGTYWVSADYTDGYLSDSPQDGKIYGRKDGGWTEVDSDGYDWLWLFEIPEEGTCTQQQYDDLLVAVQTDNLFPHPTNFYAFPEEENGGDAIVLTMVNIDDNNVDFCFWGILPDLTVYFNFFTLKEVVHQIVQQMAPQSIELGETSTTAYRGDKGKIAYDHSQAVHAPTNAQKNSDITKAEIEAKLTGVITTHSHTVTKAEIEAKLTGIINTHGHTKANVGLGNVNNTSDANKPVSTAQQTALNAKMDSSKFQVVESLPASPVSGTFYFVKE